MRKRNHTVTIRMNKAEYELLQSNEELCVILKAGKHKTASDQKAQREVSEDGKHLLEEQLKLVKLLKSKIVEVTNKEMESFRQ